MGEMKILKRRIFITFSVMLILIIGSGVLGWILTRQIENSTRVIEVVHMLKESELQLRREEKNLLIRGYSQERYLRWQKAKEDFHQKFGELIGMKALNQNEINELKTDYTEMSDNYNQFFDDIRSNTLNQEQIARYDQEFKKTGRKTLEMINSILNREHDMSAGKEWQADILIVIFLIVFIVTAGFLIVNVLKHI
jgi:hypothetical protein